MFFFLWVRDKGKQIQSNENEFTDSAKVRGNTFILQSDPMISMLNRFVCQSLNVNRFAATKFQI